MADVAAIQSLELWISKNGGYTHLSVYLASGSRGRGIFAKPGAVGELCRLPWQLLISEDLAERSLSFGCDLRRAAEEFTTAPGLLLLTAFLLAERAHVHEDCGFHRPYYQMLPRTLALPACWPEHHWLHSMVRHSHLERQIRAKRHSLGLEFSLLQSFMPDVAYEDFMWARCTVASRAYSLRGQRCLVPWADLLNHGSTEEVSARYYLDEASQSDFIMNLTKELQKDDEVLQTYGEKSNAALLLDYGFVLPKPAIACSVSMVIPMPKIPDADEEIGAAKKRLWQSEGGRIGREIVMELTGLNFQKHLEVQLAAAVCESPELKDKADPIIKQAAVQKAQTVAEQMLRRNNARECEIGGEQLEDWELVAKQACSVILEEERSLLLDFQTWLHSLEEVKACKSAAKDQAGSSWPATAAG